MCGKTFSLFSPSSWFRALKIVVRLTSGVNDFLYLAEITLPATVLPLWLNTESRGCLVTESGTMSWRLRASFWTG